MTLLTKQTAKTILITSLSAGYEYWSSMFTIQRDGKIKFPSYISSLCNHDLKFGKKFIFGCINMQPCMPMILTLH